MYMSRAVTGAVSVAVVLSLSAFCWAQPIMIEKSLQRLKENPPMLDVFDFVEEAGDMMVCGAAERVPAQWDLFDVVIAELEPPFLPLPGNHDISDEVTEEIWRKRLGPTHYTFRYGNSLFVALNGEEVGAVDRISNGQVAWLTDQLDATDAANIFVFLHKPYLAHGGDPDKAEEDWQKDCRL
jgi:hypothetical protein